jgi:hypothetical protein
VSIILQFDMNIINITKSWHDQIVPFLNLNSVKGESTSKSRCGQGALNITAKKLPKLFLNLIYISCIRLANLFTVSGFIFRYKDSTINPTHSYWHGWYFQNAASSVKPWKNLIYSRLIDPLQQWDRSRNNTMHCNLNVSFYDKDVETYQYLKIDINLYQW